MRSVALIVQRNRKEKKSNSFKIATVSFLSQPILAGRASWELSRLMADQMQRAGDLVEGLAFQPVAGRLARLLLDHFTQAGGSFILRHHTR